MIAKQEILCKTCKHFNISLCCYRPVCGEMVWDPSEFDLQSDNPDEFLLEFSKCCGDYEKDNE